MFFDSLYEFQERSLRTMIGSARMIDGLYYLDDNLLSNKQAQGLSSNRLGHPNFPYLRYIYLLFYLKSWIVPLFTMKVVICQKAIEFLIIQNLMFIQTLLFGS